MDVSSSSFSLGWPGSGFQARDTFGVKVEWASCSLIINFVQQEGMSCNILTQII